MNANDPGHINNLNKEQEANLKSFWISVIDKITSENKILLENFYDSNYGKELFYAFTYDNPDVVLLRWLRARKWNVNLALEQLMDTLKWRFQWGVNQLVAKGELELSNEEILTGKTFYIGYDRSGRPINYVSVKDHIKGQFPAEATEKLTVLSMEIGRKLLHSPVESVTVIFDMAGFSLKNMDYQHTHFLLHLLQNYYPESLGLALIVNAPWLFNSCWYIIRRWLDPVVESKFHFISNLDDLTIYIDPSNIPKRLNGDKPDFKYIPPTEHDNIMLAAFREDFYGNKKATENHRQAALNYLRITYEWANKKHDKNIVEQRKKAMKELRDAYEQVVPYISTRTHYHRNGLIDEPIFDIAYQKLQQEDQQVVHF
ncbi:unnamed protein product [Rotaria sp. Silwood1]|nr:unnamed protein product [Rotaria sp. Silwood1]CAF1306078.1 unnamed protein product [Rotaria sp. Silwood1]CAF3438071.1 unnamed protein product [Rotaria sp. Silwood1]CAF3481702.1 unnamed protein product [Rotaria sp. Silwood1]CAF4810107.1 unnamed protein product [Rotaria sp. Silwood1]